MTVKTLCSKPAFYLGAILFISVFALGAAFFAEAVLKLEPCRLCIVQRYPFALAGLLALIGLILRNKKTLITILLALCSLTFLTNSAVAVYHTGVERDWWISAVEGCSAVFEDDTGKSMLENIMSAPTGSCSEIPWEDPLLHLSMANYNVVLCLALFIFAAMGAWKIRKYPPA